jgi:hypothetical protein
MRPGRAEPAERAGDHARIGCRQRAVVEAELRHHAGLVVVDDDVGAAHDLEQHPMPVGMSESNAQ